MVNVECPGCGATYSVAEKRIPDQGLRMRCPKCSESFVVDKPGGESGPKRAPAPTRQGHGAPGSGPGAAPRSPAPGRAVGSAGAPTPPPEKRPLFAPGRPHPGAGSPNTDDVDAGFGDDGFGVIDLSLPEPPVLPPMATGPVSAGLPMRKISEADLPALAATDADLPMPAHDDLPLPVDDLPVRAPPRRPPPPPTAGRHRTDEDLPMPASFGNNLPMVATTSDLPVPARGRHDDLPSLAHDLPTPGAELPTVAGHRDLPAPHGGHVGLPVAYGRSDLPVRREGDLPMPAAGLPIPADQDLPLPSPSGDLPMPADFNFPTRIGTSADDDIPLSDPKGQLSFRPPLHRTDPSPTAPSQPQVDSAFLNDGRFPSDPAPLKADLSSDPSHLAPPVGPVGQAGAFELDNAPVDRGAPVQEQRVRIKRGPSGVLRLTLVIVPLLAIAAGVVPYLMGYGPYAYFLISDSLNRADHQRAFESFQQASRAELEADTAAEARHALEQARAQLAQMPRYEPMSAYAAYLAYMSVLRFGEDQNKALGAQLMSTIDADANSDTIALARAAQAAAESRFPEARAQLNALLQRQPDDVDAVTLAGWIALAQNDGKGAHALFEKAVALGKSARSLHGLSRAEHALDKDAEAEKHADEVLKLSKNHAGARVLAATLRWKRDRRDERAVKLLEDVVNPGAVRTAASKSELVGAFSVLGSIHVSQGHYSAAEKAFAEALKLDPQSELALVGAGELLYAAGRYQEALARFEAAQRANAESVHAAAGLCKAKLALERPKEANLSLKDLLAKTKHPLLYYWSGQTSEALGDRDAAEKVYRAAITYDPPSTDGVVQAYVALASVLGSKGKSGEAEKVLEQASDKLPDNADLQQARGQVALNAGRLDEAKQHFERALKLDANNLRARFSLAVTHRRAREFDAAAAAFDLVVKADPEFPGLALERGVMYEEMGQSDKALEMYSAALKKAPDDLDLKLRVASTQVISGQPKQALSLLRDVYKKRPRSAEVNHFLGRAIFASGDSPHEALRFLESAVQLDPNRAAHHLHAGLVAVEASRTDDAAEYADKALELDQGNGEGYWLRAMVKQKRGKTRDALDDLKIALEKNPTLWAAYATMAMCYQDQSNATLAEEAWRKAIAGNDSFADWHFRLGKLLWDRGAKDEAATHLKLSVEKSRDLKQTPGWLWNAHFLLGEALRDREPARAIEAYREFLKLSGADNAYRADAEQAIEELEGKKAEP